ncbi:MULTISPECIES: IS110 family transposase [unclassified Lysobacter]|uniref:IS110 family transposase n=1 Tax=unclassified Lysobacter TaxID=2635362 RepID=UPI001BEB0487|nr:MULTISPECIES: IS110 family transposase [unclassified Lysobacter]MBT2748347.1 IS110 family transposase [Lysobacter sp. ISL-42]MBT2749886.1 IS110 family transposase [Lysobacter sp. ISL-50]MBT2781214.1 IS110 family transposase [Lysobacter sp. ISL-52]
MNDTNTVFVGLDVHKESIVAAYSVGYGEIQGLGNIGVRDVDVARLCTRLRSKAARVAFIYEAGPCGYGLYRLLTKKGFECVVCAPSLLARKPGDHVKTDRRDATMLVRALRHGDFSPIHVPTVDDEAIRDLVRAWVSAKRDLRHAKQRLKSFLLTHGVRYEGKADWRPAHRRWLSEFVFATPWSQIAFEEHLRTITDREHQSSRLECALRELAPQWHHYPVLQSLQGLRGIQFTAAMAILAEVGDLSRFQNPRQLMAWLGITPSEYSSGARRKLGGITKAGNFNARRMLIEAAWSYRYPAKVTRIIQTRHQELSKLIVDRAWDAQLRLCGRFRKLTQQGKHPNLAVVAVARELAGFIWDIARMTRSQSAI